MDRTRSWRELGFGMFIHFGVYSVFGGMYRGEKITRGYSEQIMQFAPVPRKEYLEAANTMNLSAFSPDAIAELAKKTGMKYIVITAKHHDGFCMFETETTDFNLVQQTPFGKDLIAALAEACREHGMKFGVYFSLVDWNLGHDFDPHNRNPIPRRMEETLCIQLEELMRNYGALCEIWFDMASPTPEQSRRFQSIVRTFQPGAMINSRIGNGQGDFITFWDNEIPARAPSTPWQTPQSIYPDTWGYRSRQQHEDPKARAQILFQNHQSVRLRGGNYLLNIGPRGDGSVAPFEHDVLIELGRLIEEFRRTGISDGKI